MSETETGYTLNLKHRLQEHNTGESVHTADLRPWELCFFLGFKNKSQALEFEKYLKSHAGRAFAAKRFWAVYER